MGFVEFDFLFRYVCCLLVLMSVPSPNERSTF